MKNIDIYMVTGSARRVELWREGVQASLKGSITIEILQVFKRSKEV
jgi:hypothetical protein